MYLCACVVEKNKLKRKGISTGDSDPFLQQLKLDIDTMTDKEIESEIKIKILAHKLSQGDDDELGDKLKGYPENEIYSEFKKHGVTKMGEDDADQEKAFNAALATCLFKVKYHICVSVCFVRVNLPQNAWKNTKIKN